MLQSLFVFLYFPYVKKAGSLGFSCSDCVSEPLLCCFLSLFLSSWLTYLPPQPKPGLQRRQRGARVQVCKSSHAGCCCCSQGRRSSRAAWQEETPTMPLRTGAIPLVAFAPSRGREATQDGWVWWENAHPVLPVPEKLVKIGQQHPHFYISPCSCLFLCLSDHKLEEPFKSGEPLRRWKPLKFCVQHIFLVTVSLLTGFPVWWPHSALFSTFSFKYFPNLITLCFRRGNWILTL